MNEKVSTQNPVFYTILMMSCIVFITFLLNIAIIWPIHPVKKTHSKAKSSLSYKKLSSQLVDDKELLYQENSGPLYVPITQVKYYHYYKNSFNKPYFNTFSLDVPSSLSAPKTTPIKIRQ